MIRLEDVLKMSWRHFEDVLKTFYRCLQNVLKTSWRCLEDLFARRLEDVLKTFSKDVRLRRTYSSWLRRLPKTKMKDIFKTSPSRRIFAGKYLLTSKQCQRQYTEETTDGFRYRRSDYWSNSGKVDRKVVCIQEHLYRHFSSLGHKDPLVMYQLHELTKRIDQNLKNGKDIEWRPWKPWNVMA